MGLRPGWARARIVRRFDRLGVTFVELMVVVALVATMSGIGSLYYRTMIDTAKEERARIDLRTLAKGIQKLEADLQCTVRPAGTYPSGGPHPNMEPPDLGVNDGGFTLEKLLDFRVMASLPDDPFGFAYEVNVHEGIVYSMGPDGLTGGGWTSDDIRIEFRPPFEARRSSFAEGRGAVALHFTRKIDPYTLFFVPPDATNCLVQVRDETTVPVSSTLLPITTVVRDMTDPFTAIVRLTNQIPDNNPTRQVSVFTRPLIGPDREVRAMDGSVLISQAGLYVSTF